MSPFSLGSKWRELVLSTDSLSHLPFGFFLPQSPQTLQGIPPLLLQGRNVIHLPPSFSNLCQLANISQIHFIKSMTASTKLIHHEAGLVQILACPPYFQVTLAIT